jgi:hypothetical protein
MDSIIEIAKRVGGIVVEYQGEYKHFKTIDGMIQWAKRINVFVLKPYRDPKDGKLKMIQNFEGVNLVAHYDHDRNIKTECF